MTEGVPVAVTLYGEPFDRVAVWHTLRHVALRAGWVLCAEAEHRLHYVTCQTVPESVAAIVSDVVVLSSPLVQQHLSESCEPIPLTRTPDNCLLPFPHPAATGRERPGWIAADVIAGAHTVLNLWYERRSRALEQDGWVLFAEDWWHRVGLVDPQPLVDEWLERLIAAANQVGWPQALPQKRSPFLAPPGTLVLTHDVDYLPTSRNRGLPRLARALVRQTVSRRRLGDAMLVLAHYARALPRNTPYFELPAIASREEACGVRSSFQVTVAHHHRVDPHYDLRHGPIATTLQRLRATAWEICLHGSYTASRTPGRLAEERAVLEQILNMPIQGHRQHYLHFHPGQLFIEVERAGFAYDLSVGYNDHSGPRAGTLFPYRPYDMEHRRPHNLWEIPFVLMDTTLATIYRLSSREAWEHVQTVLSPPRGCVSVIWHQEQLGGLLDPGFDDVYYRLLPWALEAGMRLVPGEALLPDLDVAWAATVRDDGTGS